MTTLYHENYPFIKTYFRSPYTPWFRQREQNVPELPLPLCKRAIRTLVTWCVTKTMSEFLQRNTKKEGPYFTMNDDTCRKWPKYLLHRLDSLFVLRQFIYRRVLSRIWNFTDVPWWKISDIVRHQNYADQLGTSLLIFFSHYLSLKCGPWFVIRFYFDGMSLEDVESRLI